MIDAETSQRLLDIEKRLKNLSIKLDNLEGHVYGNGKEDF